MTTSELREILRGMLDSNGVLTPDIVVRDASDPEHRMHGMFEWDDKKAAHAHRLSKARAIIRRVPLIPVVRTREMIRVPEFVHNSALADRKEQGYVPIVGIGRRTDEAKYLAHDEMTRLIGNLNRVIGIVRKIGEEKEAERLEQVKVTLSGVHARLSAPRPPAEGVA